LASHGAKIAFMDFKIGCEPTFFDTNNHSDVGSSSHS
jgi:hypothetical protein